MPRTDPYGGYRFLVQINSVVAAGFTEVSGLERTVETEEYQEGGLNTYTHTFPTRATYPNLTLRTGVTDSTELWEWVDASLHGTVQRKDVTVFLQDATGVSSIGWAITQAYPVKWTGPQLRADQGTTAVETLELTHRGVTRTTVPE